MSTRHARRLTMAVAAVAVRDRAGRWLDRNRWLQAVMIAAAIASIAAVGVRSSAAILSDSTSTGTVTVTAGSVGPATNLQLADTGSAIRVSFDPPAAGLAPPTFDVFRRADGDAWPPSPQAQPGGSPWDDATATECTTWWYRVRSRHTNLVSSFTPEQSIAVDRSGPTVDEAHLYWTDSATPVRDFVRVTPGGNVVVYAQVEDNCTDQADLDVSFSFGPPFNAVVPAEYSATGWTPVGGGDTYHHRFTYALPGGAVSDGQSVTWDVVATDDAGNTTTTAGTPFTGDGTGPNVQRAEMVSAFTNFYDEAFGRGEIPSDGTARASGSYVYADLDDPSGVASVSADLAVPGSVIRSGTTDLTLDAGSFQTYGGTIDWGWRSAATQVDTGMGNGTRTFTVTATDALGNVSTSPAQLVEIDDTPLAAGTSSCTNSGDDDGRLDSGDRTDWDFGDTIFPDSVATGWTGSPLVATAVLRNGTRDHFDVNGDFGVSIFQGSAYNRSWDLNNGGWVGSDVSFPGSTITLADRTTVRLTYQGASVDNRNRQARARIGRSVRDAAGNRIASNYNEQCTTNPW